MQDFINKYGERINGTLSGFDRLVFRGTCFTVPTLILAELIEPANLFPTDS